MTAPQDLKTLFSDEAAIVPCDGVSCFDQKLLYTRPQMTPSRLHKAWNQPLLTTAVALLLEEREGRTIDLRDRLLLLPTRQAGRRLREALALEMDQRGGALFPPMTTTPWHLVRPSDEAAPELACLWHWNRILEKVDLRLFSSLFPRAPRHPDYTWRREMARTLHELRGTLAEGDLDFAAVADSDVCQEESTRWQDLKGLEAAYRKLLGRQTDLHDAKRQATHKPVLPLGINRVVILGIPDLPALIQRALEKLSTDGVPVEMVIFGPEDGKDFFDDWGRPEPECWANRKLPLADGQLNAQLDEVAQANEIVSRLASYNRNRPIHVAVGIVDTTVTPHLERALADADIPCFNPEGRLLRHAPMMAFLKTLQALLQQRSFRHADALLRLPDALGWARGQVDEFSSTRLLKGLDEIRTNHLPVNLDDAAQLFFEGKHTGNRRHARAVLRQLEGTLDCIEKTPLSEGLVEFLQEAFTDRTFTEGREEDAADLESARFFMARLAEWESVLGDQDRPPASEALTLLLELVERESIFPERHQEAVDIQGWLELAWEDAPHLIVAGANEGHLPESIHGDPFLPEKLRERLGLRTNGDRFARDAWLLELLLRTRANKGRVDILVGRQCANGDPLKPSRLLFRCSGRELPQRVECLFDKLASGPQPPSWKPAWKLKPGLIQPVEKLSATSIASYLTCPYRFYLRHVLRMELPDLEQRELDARGFGSLMHNVLDAFGRDEEARQLKEPGVIHATLVMLLDQQMEQNFGKHPPLPLLVQQGIARQRLHHVARQQANERTDGWEIIGSEKQFNEELDGIPVNGCIDRIERNANTGEVRVLDYKTSNTARQPASQHWRKYREERDTETVPDYARFEIDDKAYRWTNLQLPLYAWALETEYGADLTLGYFNLPAVGTDTGVAPLDPFGREILEAALICARGVVKDVHSGGFWPPRAKVDYDDFEGILFGLPELTAAQPGEVVA